MTPYDDVYDIESAMTDIDYLDGFGLEGEEAKKFIKTLLCSIPTDKSLAFLNEDSK